MLKPEPETVLDAESVVKEPAAADVPPIAGGEASKVVNPVPETVLEAAKGKALEPEEKGPEKAAPQAFETGRFVQGIYAGKEALVRRLTKR